MSSPRSTPSSLERTGPARKPCILVVTSARLYREGLVTALAGRDFDALGVEPAVAVDAASDVKGDVVLVDLTEPDVMDTIRAFRYLGAPPVIAFGVRDTEIAACLVAGVAGYIPCNAGIEAVSAAIRSVLDGDVRAVGWPPAAGAAPSHVITLPHDVRMLTQRERDVLGLMLAGLSNRDIARQLHIAEATVKHHVHSVLEKSHTARRTQLIARLTTSRSLLRRAMNDRDTNCQSICRRAARLSRRVG